MPSPGLPMRAMVPVLVALLSPVCVWGGGGTQQQQTLCSLGVCVCACVSVFVNLLCVCGGARKMCVGLWLCGPSVCV